jgi:hypothetical protein
MEIYLDDRYVATRPLPHHVCGDGDAVGRYNNFYDNLENDDYDE